MTLFNLYPAKGVRTCIDLLDHRDRLYAWFIGEESGTSRSISNTFCSYKLGIQF
jgi:hypothetical protein